MALWLKKPHTFLEAGRSQLIQVNAALNVTSVPLNVFSVIPFSQASFNSTIRGERYEFIDSLGSDGPVLRVEDGDGKLTRPVLATGQWIQSLKNLKAGTYRIIRL